MSDRNRELSAGDSTAQTDEEQDREQTAEVVDPDTGQPVNADDPNAVNDPNTGVANGRENVSTAAEPAGDATGDEQSATPSGNGSQTTTEGRTAGSDPGGPEGPSVAPDAGETPTDTASTDEPRQSQPANGTLSSGPDGQTAADVTSTSTPQQQQSPDTSEFVDGPGLEVTGSGLNKQRAQRLQKRVIEQNEQITSPTQVRVTRDGDTFEASLTKGGREQLAANQLEQQNPGSEFDVTDIRSGADGLQLTDSGLNKRQQAREQQLDEMRVRGGPESQSFDKGQSTVTEQGFTSAARDSNPANARSTTAARTSGSSPAGSVTGAEQGVAANEIEQQLEQTYDADFEPGEDFKVQQTSDGFRATLTERGQDKLPPGATGSEDATTDLSLGGFTVTERDVATSVGRIGALTAAGLGLGGQFGEVTPDAVDDVADEQPVQVPRSEREFLATVFGGADDPAREAEDALFDPTVGEAGRASASGLAATLGGPTLSAATGFGSPQTATFAGEQASAGVDSLLSSDTQQQDLVADGEAEFLDEGLGGFDEAVVQGGQDNFERALRKGRTVDESTTGGSPFAYVPIGPTSAVAAFRPVSTTIGGSASGGAAGGSAVGTGGTGAATGTRVSAELLGALGLGTAGAAVTQEDVLPARDSELEIVRPATERPEAETPEQPADSGELPVEEPSIDEAAVPEQGSVFGSEIDTPDQPESRTNPRRLTLSPSLTGQQEGEQEEDAEEDADELGPDLDPFDRSDRRLRDPTRRFTGAEESVVSNVERESTELDDAADDIGSGIQNEGDGLTPARDVETVEENFQRYLEEQQERSERATRREALRESPTVESGESSVGGVEQPRTGAQTLPRPFEGVRTGLESAQRGAFARPFAAADTREDAQVRERQRNAVRSRVQADTPADIATTPTTQSPALTRTQPNVNAQRPLVDAVEPFEPNTEFGPQFGQPNETTFGFTLPPGTGLRGLRRLPRPNDEGNRRRRSRSDTRQVDDLFASGIQDVSEDDLDDFFDADSDEDLLL